MHHPFLSPTCAGAAIAHVVFQLDHEGVAIWDALAEDKEVDMNRQRVEEKAGDVIEMMISDVLRLDAGTLHAYARARSLSLSCTQTL